MVRYIMSITAQDRPGIVAGVSEAAAELGGNVEAASQTVHQGYFAMMVLWSLPDEVSKEALIQQVHERAGANLHVFAADYRPSQPAPVGDKQAFIVTSIGPDKPGILRTLSSYLASRQINIDDLYAVVKDGDFLVICQVSVPGDVDVFMLQADLEAVGEELGVAVQMQHEDIFVATSELSLRR